MKHALICLFSMICLFSTAKDESHLVNIITKAVMPGYIKKGRLTREEIGQAFFDTFVQDKMLRPHEKGASQVMEVWLANKEKQNS